MAPRTLHRVAPVRTRPLLMRTMRVGKASSEVLNKIDKVTTVAQLNEFVLDGFGLHNHHLLSGSALLEHVSSDISHTGQFLATTKIVMEVLEWAFRRTRRRSRSGGIQSKDCGGSLTLGMAVVYIVMHLL